MKIIKIIFLSLLALSLIAGTGIFIFFQTFDTDQYLPQITQKASLALGRPVSVGQVGLGLSSRGITLDVGPIIVEDDSNFTSQPFIKIDRVRISLALKPLIFQHEIHITHILLQSPQIHFIRSQEGNINARSIGQIPSGDETAVIANYLSGVKKPNGGFIASLFSGIKRPDRGDLTSYLSGVIARSEETKRSFNKHRARYPVIKSITIQDASVSFIDQNQAMPLDIWLTNINASLKDFSLSKPLRLSFSASLYSNDSNVRGRVLVSLDLSKRSVEISDLSLRTDLSRVDIEQLKGISPGVKEDPILKNIAGVMQLNIAHLGISASGDFEANGDLIFTDGIIKNFNVIKTVLSHTLGAFGGMDGNIGKLGGNDTIINKVWAHFSIHDKTIFIDDSLIQTNIFEFTAKGSVDQELNMDMQTMLHVNGDVSAALATEFEGVKYLMDDSKRIAVGASLKGVIPHLKYKLDKDLRKKSRKMLMEEGGNILGAILSGAQTSSQGQDTASQDTGKKHKIKFKDILGDFLK